MTHDPNQPPRHRHERAEVRRRQIVEAALELFARHGYAATTTKAIAQQVGVTEGLIFHYFPTKAELLRAAVRERRSFVGEVQALLVEAGDAPARDVLRHIVMGWVEAIRHQQSLVTVLLVESQANEELGRAFRAVVGELVAAMSGYLQARVAAGELREDLPTTSSAMMFFSSLMVFFLTHRHLDEAAWHDRATAFTREMLDTWFRGSLAGAPAAADRPATEVPPA